MHKWYQKSLFVAWNHSSVGILDRWNARLADVSAWQVLAVQVKALQWSFYFEFPIFPRYQKILSLQKQWEALRRMKAWVGMQPHHILLSKMCSHWKALQDVWTAARRRRVSVTFFILETKWNYHMRIVAFSMPCVPQFDFFIWNYINNYFFKGCVSVWVCVNCSTKFISWCHFLTLGNVRIEMKGKWLH